MGSTQVAVESTVPVVAAEPVSVPSEGLSETEVAEILADVEGEQEPVAPADKEPVAVEPAAVSAPAVPVPAAQPAVVLEPKPANLPASAPVAAVSEVAAYVEPPAAPVPTREEQLVQLKALRERTVKTIVDGYALSEADKDRFAVEPEKVLPEIAGRLFLDVYDAVYQNVLAQLPTLMRYHTQVGAAENQREEAFFTRWPALKKPEYQQQLTRAAATYRQLNPTISFEQAVEEIGALLHMQLRIPLEPSAAPAASVLAQSVAAPFTPAGAGAAAAPAPAPAEDSWASLTSEFANL